MLSELALTNFRNFEKASYSVSETTTVIVGPNAQGKTNLLESMYLLSTGKSFKAKVEEEMVNHDADIGRVVGQVTGEEGTLDLEVILTRGEIDIGADRPEKVARKRLLVNKVGKRLVDFAGNFKVVLFGPWDLDLVTESPSIRRKFLDAVLSLSDREYRRAILSYEKGLRQRNRLLFRIREEGVSRSQLLFWNKLLVKNGDYVSTARENFISFVNESGPINNETFSLLYDKSAISEVRLEQYASEEVAAATTLVGPHRDDFIFEIHKKGIKRELARFGSRGEQRMGVLWLKLSEINFVEKDGERPTLLLDDIFSELDHEHRDIVMDVTKNQQTVITTADPHFVESLNNIDTIEIGK